jgi:hypothetical protein
LRTKSLLFLPDGWIVAGLSLLALLVRLPYLALIPYFEDETLEVLTALKVWPGGQWIAVAWDNYIGPLLQYLLAFLFWALGPDLALARVVVLVTGALTVGATYALARALKLDRFGAAIAGLLVLANPQHILINSHIVWSNSVASLFTTLLLLTLAQAVKRQQPRWLLAAGVLAGMSMQFHPVSSLMLIGVAVWFIGDGEARRLLRTKWPYLAGVLALACYANVIISNLQSGLYGVAEAQSRAYIWQLSPSLGDYGQNAGRLALQLLRVAAGEVSDVETWSVLIGWPSIYVVWLLAGVVQAVRSRLKMPLWIVGTLLVFMPVVSNHYGTLVTTRLTNQFTPLVAIMMGLAASRLVMWVRQRGAMRTLGLVTAAACVIAAVFPLAPLFDYYQQRVAQGRTNAEFFPFVEALKARANGAPIYLSTTVSELRLGGSGNVNYVIDIMLSLAQLPHQQLPPAQILENLIAQPGRALLVLHAKDLETLRPYVPFTPIATEVDAAALKRGYGLYEVPAGARIAKPDFVLAAASALQPQHIVKANFENKIELLGYDLPSTTYRPGDQMRLKVYWRALDRMAYIYTGFAHLIGSVNPAAGNPLWGQDDHELGRGLYRTLIWQPGEVVVEEYIIPIEAGAPDGSYQLVAGAYDPKLARLKQVDRNGAAADDKVNLAEITVAR